MKLDISQIIESAKTYLLFPSLMVVSGGLSILITFVMGAPFTMPITELSRPTGLPELKVGYVKQAGLNQDEKNTVKTQSADNIDQFTANSESTTGYLAYQYAPGSSSQASVVSTPGYGQCNQSAAQQAQDQWESDSANEQSYHENQVEQINQIPDENARAAALEQENARHQSRQAQIDSTYSQQLDAANCS